MAKLKKHMYQHLRSAKEWLTKAEEAFDKEHDIRAELDLMLAQAELQHAKESNRSRQWRYKYVIFRHGMALSLAVFMAVALGGMYWWTTRPVLAIPVPMAVQANLPVEEAPKVQERIEPAKEQVIMPQENIPVTQIVKEPQSNSAQVSSPKARQLQAPPLQEAIVLSDDEVQKLVRAAGKSLRGQ